MAEARTTWLTNGQLITPKGLVRGAVGIRDGRIVAIRSSAPRGERGINMRGRFVSPGFIDLHVWGDPAVVARHVVRGGTTGFLTTLGPEPPELLVNDVVRVQTPAPPPGARCLGIHLEGPFLNPFRAGALASRWLRPPTSRELRQLVQHADGRLILMTIAPELPKGLEAIRWCARHGVTVSLGHSDANAAVTQRAVKAGAAAVTHVFNGMRPLHHRDPGLLGEVLTDDRLAAMVILDGVHVDPIAFQMLLRCKGARGIILATDSITHHHRQLQASAKRGAYYTKAGVLAGSRLSLIQAVRNATTFGKVPLLEAVRMASLNPARLIGRAGQLGSLEVGKRADLTVFDGRFRVSMTIVNGQVVYRRRQYIK